MEYSFSKYPFNHADLLTHIQLYWKRPLAALEKKPNKKKKTKQSIKNTTKRKIST